MGKLVRIYVDEDLQDVMIKIRKKLALQIKKKYNLKEITISDGFTSQFIAAKLNKEKFINFKIKKQDNNKALLKFL